jgi:divalent metal cation (Fe/Co/Zn/Cd) transporter
VSTQPLGLGIRTSRALQPPAAVGSTEWLRMAGWARSLSWISLVWMSAEGAIAIVAGLLAGSVALVGFGLDSGIEGFASAIIIWRFTGKRILSEHAERRAQQLVAGQFFLLAPYIAVEAIRALGAGEHAAASWLGVALAITSLIGMPVLGIAKRRIGERLGSVATKGEGAQNLLCSYLAGALLVGLLGNALLGAWWLDPAVALLIAAVAVREGVLAWRGEGCGCCEPAVPLMVPSSGCAGDCCSSTGATEPAPTSRER